MTSDLFFFGTLRDEALRHIVLGRETRVEAAQLSGFRTVDAVTEGPLRGAWPVLIPDDSLCAEGVVLRDVSDKDLERLDFLRRWLWL